MNLSQPKNVREYPRFWLPTKKKENLIITSSISHIEVLPEKLGDKGAKDEEDYMALFDAEHFLEVEISTNIILRAREIRNHYYIAADENGRGGKMMDIGDAIHLATASIYGVNEFHTRDKDKKGSKIPLLNLYAERGETKLCEKYDLKIISPEAEQGVLPLDPVKKPEA